MSPSRPFIERPVATSLLMAGLLIAGVIAYELLPVSALPEVDYPTIQVTTAYPGAGPEIMASSVTAPLERQLGQVPGLTQMTSTSSSGLSQITLQFSLELNIDIAEQEVQASINAAGTYLPRDLPNPPIYNKANPADAPIITLALTSDTLPLTAVQDLADTRLAQRISQLPGVGLVAVTGGHKPAVRVRANPTALASRGLGMDDLRAAIGAANVDQPKGSFDGPDRSASIAADDQLHKAAAYADVVIAWRDGAPVRVGDVATVVDGEEDARQAAWADGVPAILIDVRRQPGANIIQVVDRVRDLLPRLSDTLPPGVGVRVLADRTTTIRASVDDVKMELALAIALVVLVIFVFLRDWRATIVPAIAVPLTLVGTFGCMWALGYSLNNLTLMALVISTGFVVDDAIVMIENVARYVEMGKSAMAAALEGAAQIGFTILSLSLSLIAVLIPLLFMGDIVGRLFREFAMTLAAAIVVSAAVSLSLTPMLCARLLRAPPEHERGWLYRVSERGFLAVIGFYERTLRVVLRHRALTLLVAIGTLAATFALLAVIPKGFFPVQDTGGLIGITEAPQTASFDALVERQRALADEVAKDPAVATVASFVGVDGIDTVPTSGRLQIQLKPEDERDVDASGVIDRLRAKLANYPGIELWLQPVQDLTIENRVSRTRFQYAVENPDAAELAKWVPRFVDRLRARPELRDIASDLHADGLQAVVEIDRDSAARLGVTVQAIDDALYDAFGQRQVSTMFTQLNQYHVVLEAMDGFRRSPADLDAIRVPGANGARVPLTAVARVGERAAPLLIAHQAQFPATTISFDVAPGYALGDAVRAVRETQAAVGLPAGTQADFEGTARAFAGSLANQALLILAAVATVYIVLGVLYESFIHPITILSTLPSASLGALLAMLACKVDFGVIALIGIILLIGIVEKNAIMMIDFALDAERREGKPPEEAIFQACVLRFRPILMTTLAALLGGVPLAVGGGVGAELRRPLGVAIVGGLIVSQLLTLYTTPVIYLAFDAIARRLSPRRREQLAAAAAAHPADPAPAR